MDEEIQKIENNSEEKSNKKEKLFFLKNINKIKIFVIIIALTSAFFGKDLTILIVAIALAVFILMTLKNLGLSVGGQRIVSFLLIAILIIFYVLPHSPNISENTDDFWNGVTSKIGKIMRALNEPVQDVVDEERRHTSDSYAKEISKYAQANDTAGVSKTANDFTTMEKFWTKIETQINYKEVNKLENKSQEEEIKYFPPRSPVGTKDTLWFKPGKKEISDIYLYPGQGYKVYPSVDCKVTVNKLFVNGNEYSNLDVNEGGYWNVTGIDKSGYIIYEITR